MDMKTVNCRAHGGTFETPVRRGRPPVSCATDNPCTKAVAKAARASRATNAKSARDEEALRNAIKREIVKAGKAPDGPVHTGVVKAARKTVSTAQRRNNIRNTPLSVETNPPAPAETVPAANKGQAKALAARDRLQPLGWTVTARKDGTDIVLSAARGEERLELRWTSAGVLKAQQYDLWDLDTPKRNSVPAHKLSFEPDETSDAELVRAISGMTVTWWNSLAQAIETAVVSAERVVINHRYDGKGDETPGDRIITFVDHAGTGFRSFRAGALLKIG